MSHYTHRYYFELKPGSARLLLLATVALLLLILSAYTLPSYAVVLFFALFLSVAWLLRTRQKITKIAYMDDEQWTLQWQNGEISSGYLYQVQNFGYFILLYFSDEQGQKCYNLCIAKDQLPLADWCRLKAFVRLCAR